MVGIADPQLPEWPGFDVFALRELIGGLSSREPLLASSTWPCECGSDRCVPCAFRRLLIAIYGPQAKQAFHEALPEG